MMDKSLARLNNYISQMADYSRRGVTSEISEINAQKLVEEIRSNFQFIKEAEKIRFTPNFDLKMPVFSDQLRLQMILNNLISNAIKYHYLNQDDPYVELSFFSNSREITIIVKDNGIGIKKKSLPLIFDKFQRVTENSEGTGIGLHIVKKAIDKLGGSITVESEVNQGTLFTVNLPNHLPNQEELLLEATRDN